MLRELKTGKKRAQNHVRSKYEITERRNRFV
jgi:hypothetical protein